MVTLKFFLFLVFISYIPSLSLSVRSRRQRRVRNVVNETLQVLSEGEKLIHLLPSHTDVVLVIGNTGAGKTTITKFLTTDGSDMEAYKKGGRILIRDRAGKIGTNSTVKSKTIFPELMIHPESGLAFYDMPGFSDTRNAAIPIANAFFMKRVTEHAQRVKLLFIVSHNSVLAGGYRSDFLNLVKSATSLIPNVEKFSRGIALIVTKVELDLESGAKEIGEEKTDEIIDYIVDFLDEVKEVIPQVIDQPEDQLKAQHLVDAFLDRESGEEKIGIFLQPTKIGPITQDSHFQSTKSRLTQLIFNKTVFVPASPSDFGMMVDPEVKLLVSNMAAEVEGQLSGLVRSLVKVLQKYYEGLTIDVRGDEQLVQKLSTDYNVIKSKVDEFRASGTASQLVSKILAFYPDPKYLVDGSKLEELRAHIEVIKNLNGRLNFFHEIVPSFKARSSTNVTVTFDPWLQPFDQLVRFIQEQWQWKLKEYNHDKYHRSAKRSMLACSISLVIPPSSLLVCPVGGAMTRRAYNKIAQTEQEGISPAPVTAKSRRRRSIYPTAESSSLATSNRIFHQLDLNHDGVLDLEDAKLGATLDYPFFVQWLKSAGRNLDRQLSVEEWRDFFQPASSVSGEIAKIFRNLDLNEDGTISRGEMGQVLQIIGVDLDVAEFDSIFSQIDHNSNSVLEFKEFARWIQSTLSVSE